MPHSSHLTALLICSFANSKYPFSFSATLSLTTADAAGGTSIDLLERGGTGEEAGAELEKKDDNESKKVLK